MPDSEPLSRCEVDENGVFGWAEERVWQGISSLILHHLCASFRVHDQHSQKVCCTINHTLLTISFTLAYTGYCSV